MQFVKDLMPLNFFTPYNKARQKPADIFTDTHKHLVTEGGEWLNKTSQSCSVVAALIATVTFAKHPPPYQAATIKIMGYQFSKEKRVLLVMFLAILTFCYEERDFNKGLPRMLFTGLTSLFISIASMLISLLDISSSSKMTWEMRRL
ncbi:hypothetical protein RJ639_020655 [Escallonia herrerae]|uniref:PGG domain-containing protein n=1 Tax=Escallonia herrerae TaxID=1293975 RepID=A0AA88V416_9ASTE|nr:hypothetical protein RJ639_020655 [Escallonia herrerae]